jgi:transcriptional regulator with XRE-family HTH domain
MQSGTKHDGALLKAHRLHAGVYRRVATKLGVDPSYVSRVAAGEREEPEIRRAILDELRKIAEFGFGISPEINTKHSGKGHGTVPAAA